jgi:hypothetical protein
MDFRLRKILIFSLFLFGIVSAGVLPAYASERLLSGFENRSSWTLEHLRGNTRGSKVTLSAEAIYGKSSLRLEFKPGSPGVDEVALVRRGNWDLSRYARLEFWVKGLSQGDRFFFSLEDASGRGKSYRFTPDYMLYDIFTPRWRRITIKPDSGILDWAKITKIAFVINDADAPGQNQTTYLNIDALSAARGQPRLKLNYPQEFIHKKNGRLDVLLISAGITVEKQRWNLREVLNKHFRGVKIAKIKYWYTPWLYKGKLTGSFPFYKDLTREDLVILENWDTDALGKVDQSMLKDYVQGGGSLLILGGYYSLGAAKLKDTILSDILPFTPEGYFDFRRAGGETIQIKPGSFLRGVFKGPTPAVFWYQTIKPKPGAQVQMSSESGAPLFITWSWGRGRVAAMALTVLGSRETISGSLPFWKSRGYGDFLTRVVDYLTGGTL